ncbi:MAG TPA: hypothetical protein VMA73_07165 [Streptosporangiaceae bacterium]|nr:hypothetical protein [Streptosporangiaceae bacterium]
MSRVAGQLAVPAVLGLVIGVMLAFQSGTSNAGLTKIPLGTYVTPTASNIAAALATAAPPASMKSNTTCDIIVPANPLSAQGLATPYLLTGPNGTTPTQSGCEMSNGAKLGAFVQATILDPATGALSVYEPLVITQGTRPDTPGMKLNPPVIPADAVVTIDFGFNGTHLVQVGAAPTTLAGAHCVSGQAGSAFGQTSFCNGANFFNAVRQAERKGLLKVPSPGTSNAIVPSGGNLGTGRSCPVISNFEVAGLDPGESVTTTYLLNPLTGQTAQNNATNQAYIAGATLLHGNSANAVLDQYIDPILGCAPFMAPDLSHANVPTFSEALDEIAAGAHQPKTAALVPENDKVVMDGGKSDPAKTDLYRAELGQPLVSAATNKSSSPAMYCQNLVGIQTPFLAANQKLLAAGQSPVTATANNLLTFLANDLSASFTSLGCQQFHLTNPVTLKRNSAGMVIAATFDTAGQTAM